MNFSFHDPAISISIGIILIGFAFLVWAIGKLRQKAPSTETTDLLNSLSTTPSPADDFFGTNRSVNTETTPTPEPEPTFVAPVRSAPASRPEPVALAIRKEMVERLDGMSQRLSEMQTVLQRQANAPAGPSSPLTPEAIDKLLKIIGNVTQQVDTRQRSLGSAPKTTEAANKPLETISAAANPSPASKPISAGDPLTTKPNLKGVGLVGGALNRQAPPSAKPAQGLGPTTPPNSTPAAKPDSAGPGK